MKLNKTKEKSIEDIKKELELKKISHPFEDDLLDLKPFAETISNIVVSTKDPFVFSINSPYGTGKTFFLRRLHCLLEQKGCLCVSYNAWESDFYDNPLPAIISALERQTVTQKIIDTSKQVIKNVSKTSLNPLKKVIEEIAILFERKEKIYDDFKKYQEAKEKFIKDLSNFVEKKNKKLVFIIDELDRCRPDYAIKTLETIKHFFNIPNIVFIIGVDRKQIESTVKVLYGANIENNCDEYLRKFIDQDFYLPHTKIENYIWKLCEKHLTETLTGFIREYITDYRLHLQSMKIYSVLNLNTLVEPMNNIKDVIDTKILVSSLLKNIIEIIVIYVCALSEFFSFSLRRQEQFILFLKLFFQSLDIKKDPLYPELACLLTAIRLNDYNDILSDDVTIFNLITKFVISKSQNIQKKDDFIKKMGGSLHRDKINYIVRVTSFKPDHIQITNSIKEWGMLYFNDNIHQLILLQNKYVPAGIDTYRNIIKHLTILTTENK